MKKYVFILSVLLIVFNITFHAFAATVTPQTFPGNTMNTNDYTPPDGYIVYQIPNSNIEGTYTVNFNSDGRLNSNYSFTATIGTLPNNDYTQILLWRSNFPVYAVLVNGERSFNFYPYDESIREDINLTAPTNQSGFVDNISSIAIVFSSDSILPALQATSTTPVSIILIIVFLIISTVLLGIIAILLRFLIFGSHINAINAFINLFQRISIKRNRHNKGKKDIEEKDRETDKDNDSNRPDHYDPFDCHLYDRFPYTNRFHDFFNNK